MFNSTLTLNACFLASVHYPRCMQQALPLGLYTHSNYRNTHTHIHIHTRTHTHTLSHTHSHSHTHTLTPSYIHTHSYTHTHTSTTGGRRVAAYKQLTASEMMGMTPEQELDGKVDETDFGSAMCALTILRYAHTSAYTHVHTHTRTHTRVVQKHTTACTTNFSMHEMLACAHTHDVQPRLGLANPLYIYGAFKFACSKCMVIYGVPYII